MGRKSLLGIILGIILIATPAFAWNLFFIAQQEVIGQQEGQDVYGYKLGPEDTIVQLNQVVNIKTVDANHMILYITKNNSIANECKDWTEFRGFGYTDMVMRVAQGLSNGTLNEIEYITGAHWYTGGEWHFGSVKDWKTAGSPATVWFGKLRDIYGVGIE